MSGNIFNLLYKIINVIRCITSVTVFVLNSNDISNFKKKKLKLSVCFLGAVLSYSLEVKRILSPNPVESNESKL